ncbi:hypothetical protein AB0442_31030 [Kitasatospora sp. NPDC085895]|uniref:hypothetical protein n=1 Tax=Kitasatospora sp. NPDC085895 TaxID=3155057 RepID=UPI00344B944E
MTATITGRQTVCGPFTVSIEDVTTPATFNRLDDALAALWDALRALPLGWTQYDAYRYFLTEDDAPRRVAEFLARDGYLALSFTMAGRPHAVRVEMAS